MKKIKKTTVMLLAAVILLVGVSSYGVYADAARKKLSLNLENVYQRSILETIAGLQNVELDLSKLLVTNDNVAAIKLLSGLAVRANATQINLSQLPIEHIAIQNTLKFSNQLMSYALFCSEKLSDGEELPDDYDQNIEKLHQTAVSINTELDQVSELLEMHEINVTDLNTDINGDVQSEDLPNILGDSEKDSIKYPTLIFDGPFSDGQETNTPKIKREKVTAAQAQKVLEKLIDKQFTSQGEVNGEIPSYAYILEREDSVAQAQMTQAGGLLYWYADTRAVNEAKLDAEEAQKKAEAFAQKLDYGEVAVVWEEQYDNAIVFNFAPVQDEIILYPDLFKVKVALDDGEIIGFEGRSYIVNHQDRELPAPKITQDEAKAKVHKSIKLETGRLTIAPLSNKEVLCWEFFGKRDKTGYVVYISAIDGSEQGIFRIISTETGEMIV